MSPVELPPVPAPDEAALATARAHRRHLPAGAHGRWALVLDQLSAVRARSGPTRRPRLVVLAAEHGVADLGVSAYEPSATATRVAALRDGTGVVSGVARTAGVGIVVTDLGVLHAAELAADAGPAAALDAAVSPTAPADEAATETAAGEAGTTRAAVDDERLRVGPSGAIDTTDALDADEVTAAIERGRAVADHEIDSGADLLIGATCGVGVSTPSAALLAALTGMEPVDATGRGSGIDDQAWIVKVAAVRDALFRIRRAAVNADVPTMLRVAGGADLAALTGLIAQAAVRRTPVVVHDLPSAVAAVLAHRLAPGADTAMVALTAGSDRGTRRALDLLGLVPLTDWAGTGDSGLGALLVVPALWAAETAAYGHSPAAVSTAADSGSTANDPDQGVDGTDGESASGDGARSAHAVQAWDAELL